MTTRQQLQVLLLISFVVPCATTTAAIPDQPNIVLFLIDDLGWMDLGCQGSTYYQTPNIDRLAGEGARFTNAYAACAVCSPTRAAVLTGKYPARLLLTNWLPSGRWDPTAKMREGRFVRGLPLEEVTLAEALREGGYRTMHVGKWHLGSAPFCLPEHHGFDINVAGNAHGAPGQYFFPYQGNWSIPTTGQRARWNVLAKGENGEYLTDRLTDEAVALINKSHDDNQPFFLYFPHYGVHTPLQARQEVTKKYERVPKGRRQGKPVYAAMVESIDDSVGRVLQVLEQRGIAQNTVVIFTSDNGGFYKATSNAPLRANKGSYYEGGIRVPLIVKWPGVSVAGSVVEQPVISNDLYPTCLDAGGLSQLPNQHQDGVSLRPALARDGSLPQRSLFWHFPHYNKHPSSHPSSVIRKGDWKLIETFDPAGVELYNLVTDLSETTNLSRKQSRIREAMLDELKEWRSAVGAEPMLPNPDYRPTSD